MDMPLRDRTRVPITRNDSHYFCVLRSHVVDRTGCAVNEGKRRWQAWVRARRSIGVTCPASGTPCRRGPGSGRRGAFAALCLIAASIPASSNATVYEYTRDGRVVVKDSLSVQAPAQPTRPIRIAASYTVYRDLAEQVALRHAGGEGPRRAGLDAQTFAQVFVELVRAESGFDPRALSPKGAQGLGQLMPDTARALGVRDPWNPEANLDGAARYFAAQLDQFGDVRLALAAYNAGPHRVVQYGGMPPFRETRAYVAKITAAVASVQNVNPAPVSPRTGQTVRSTRRQKDSSVWQY